MIVLPFVVLCLLTLLSAFYQEYWGNNRESVPFWMGLAVFNLVGVIGAIGVMQ